MLNRSFHSADYHAPTPTNEDQNRMRFRSCTISITFLAEEQKCSSILEVLNHKPFYFSHQVELVSQTNFCVGSQKFFGLDPKLPLLASNPVHSGSRILRFTLLVHNLPMMTDFYRSLTGLESESERSSFTLFSFPSKHKDNTCKYEVQLALKHSPDILPESMSDVFIKLELNNINLFTKFYSQWKLEIGPNGNFITRDPEDNLLIIETENRHTALKFSTRTRTLDMQTSRNHPGTSEVLELKGSLTSTDTDSGLATSLENTEPRMSGTTGSLDINATKLTNVSHQITAENSKNSQSRSHRKKVAYLV